MIDVPVTVTIEFGNSYMGDFAELLPGAKRIDGRTIEITAKTMPEAYQKFRAAVNLVPG